LGGAEAARKLIGTKGGRLLRFIGNNGFLTSFMVRQVPTGPFILVNLALGASDVRASWFIAGTGLGILPKILLVAFGAHGIGKVLQGENLSAMLFFVAAAIISGLIVFVVRPFFLKRQLAEDQKQDI
jgi:uncharacterized membrane protein YdjX (TVP38/TMEM64 family)